MIGLDARGFPLSPDAVAVDPEHWLAPHLLFAWAGAASGGGNFRNLVGLEEELAPIASTVVTDSEGDGWGVDCTAADRAFKATLVDTEPYRLGGTMLWRGVLRGDPGTTNYADFFTIGNSSQSMFAFCRVHNQPNKLTMVSQSGGSYIIGAEIDFGLSSHYNQPITLAVSHAAGTNGGKIAAVSRTGLYQCSDYGYAGNTNRPFNVNGSETIHLGINAGAGRHANAICTGAAFWNLPLLNNQDLLDLCSDFDSVFRSLDEDGADIENLTSGGGSLSDVYLQSSRRGIAVGIARGV